VTRVRVLFISEHAEAQLLACASSAIEARQLLQNEHVVTRNPNAQTQSGRLMIGRTDGGRALTLAIYPTADTAAWTVATGWPSSNREVRALERETV
jgi:hypothetical protein